ncbi:hypothetical protein L1281_000025 [Neisseria sp. HSC-16F19]|nr:hypothetical protein [Neisseria sp. HSC-16F19]MCP2039460.1 hypothetical protein [Neisseria sp. HSC-16F19]
MMFNAIEWLLNHLPVWLHLALFFGLAGLSLSAARFPLVRSRLLYILPLLLLCSAAVGGALVGVLIGMVAADSIRCEGWLCALGMVMRSTDGFATLACALAVAWLLGRWRAIRVVALHSARLWRVCAVALTIYALFVGFVVL